MFGFKWTYRVRDCKKQTVALCQSLDQVDRLVGGLSPFLRGLLEQGLSVSDGQQYKVDVRGSFCDGSWSLR